MRKFLTKIKIEQISCHVCNEKYQEMDIGENHVYATCKKCERRDEVGLVWKMPR